MLLTKPATDSWPTYSGDYSGRRFSSLTQINQTNVKNLGLAWVSHLAPWTRSPPDRLPGEVRATQRPSSAVRLKKQFRYVARGVSPARSCK